MRVLIATMQYGPGYSQGTERYVSILMDGMRRCGHEVICLAGDPLHLRKGREFGSAVEGMKEGGIRHYPSAGWLSVKGLAIEAVEDFLRKWRPDIVHLANPAHIGIGIMSVARKLGIPVVATIMDYWWLCPSSTLLRRPGNHVCDGTPHWRDCVRCIASGKGNVLSRTMRKAPELAMAAMAIKAIGRGQSLADVARWPGRREFLLGELSRASRVIFPSHAAKELIASHLRRHDTTEVIPYGLEPEWFALTRQRNGVRKSPEDLVLGYAGAIAPHKAPHLLLDAVRLLGWHKTQIRIAGKGDDGRYQRFLKANAQGLNVEFTGMVARDRMPEFYRSLDILALASLWAENLPFVLLEAQASGADVVASDVAGIGEQVTRRELRFAQGSAQELAKALAFARENPGIAGPAQVSHAQDMVDATQAAYASAANKGAREYVGA